MKRDIEKAWQWRARSKPLRHQSPKRQRENAIRDRLVPRPTGQPCEAQLSGCTWIAVDRHEVKSRARGGSITQRENVRLLCRACHQWVTEHPAEAASLGFLRASWEVS